MSYYKTADRSNAELLQMLKPLLYRWLPFLVGLFFYLIQIYLDTSRFNVACSWREIQWQTLGGSSLLFYFSQENGFYFVLFFVINNVGAIFSYVILPRWYFVPTTFIGFFVWYWIPIIMAGNSC